MSKDLENRQRATQIANNHLAQRGHEVPKAKDYTYRPDHAEKLPTGWYFSYPKQLQHELHQHAPLTFPVGLLVRTPDFEPVEVDELTTFYWLEIVAHQQDKPYTEAIRKRNRELSQHLRDFVTRFQEKDDRVKFKYHMGPKEDDFCFLKVDLSPDYRKDVLLMVRNSWDGGSVEWDVKVRERYRTFRLEQSDEAMDFIAAEWERDWDAPRTEPVTREEALVIAKEEMIVRNRSWSSGKNKEVMYYHNDIVDFGDNWYFPGAMWSLNHRKRHYIGGRLDFMIHKSTGNTNDLPDRYEGQDKAYEAWEKQYPPTDHHRQKGQAIRQHLQEFVEFLHNTEPTLQAVPCKDPDDPEAPDNPYQFRITKGTNNPCTLGMADRAGYTDHYDTTTQPIYLYVIEDTRNFRHFYLHERQEAVEYIHWLTCVPAFGEELNRFLTEGYEVPPEPEFDW